MTKELIVLCDSREQIPLKFNRYKDVSWEQVEGLPFGDYWGVIDGKVSNTVFERKSKGDLWGTMTKGYERFKREFNRSIKAGSRMVLIVECPISNVHKGHSYPSGGRAIRSKYLGTSMCKKLETLRLKHGLEVVYCDGRTDMKRYMFERWSAESRLK